MLFFFELKILNLLKFFSFCEINFSEVLKKFGEMQSQYTAVRLLKRSKKLGKQIDGLIDNGFNYSFTFGESSELKPLSK